MTIVRISSARDLADWVADHAGDNVPQEDVARICRCVWGMAGSPNWGEDWREFLDSLPDPLLSLLDEA